MWKLSSLKSEKIIVTNGPHADVTQTEISPGVWFPIPAKPLNEDYRSFKQRVKEAWAVFTGKASAFTWD